MAKPKNKNKNNNDVIGKSSRNPAILGTFTGKCGDSVVFNNNQMKLGRELFEKLFASEEFKRAMKLRHYIGFLGHPEDPGCMDFEHACIVMTECHIEPNGEIVGTFDLIDTPVGRIVKVFIDAGVAWGISIRGAGDIDANGEVDPETFVFRGFDIVTFPAYDDAIPVFQEIAASSDLTKQVQYKKVCSVLRNNLSAINSSTSLDIMKEQFSPDSKEYKAIEARKLEIDEQDDNVDDNGIHDTGLEDVTDVDITEQKLEGMTQLYLQQVGANSHLQKQLNDARIELQKCKIQTSRQMKSLKRLTSSQTNDLLQDIQHLQDDYRTSVAANRKLKQELRSVSEQNLNYKHKIRSHSEVVSEKDSVISKLRSDLRETVTASTELKGRASNLDEQVRDLQSRLVAAEQLIFTYQEAYSNIYANALGVHLENIPISATTTVEELRQLIAGGTSMSNMSASPQLLEAEEIDVVDNDDFDEDTMVAL